MMPAPHSVCMVCGDLAEHRVEGGLLCSACLASMDRDQSIARQIVARQTSQFQDLLAALDIKRLNGDPGEGDMS
jgi:reverse gyrase